jgi:hypothetical protein
MTASEHQDLVAWNALTDDDRDRAFATMPDMLDGFMKLWGWLHFAKAIEDICREKNPPKGTSGSDALDGWTRISERLPELGQSVALIHEDRYENTGGDLEMNVRACGYLHEMRPGDPYWSIRGERATCLDAFTHWLALPAIAAQAEGGAA